MAGTVSRASPNHQCAFDFMSTPQAKTTFGAQAGHLLRHLRQNRTFNASDYRKSDGCNENAAWRQLAIRGRGRCHLKIEGNSDFLVLNGTARLDMTCRIGKI